MKLALALNLIIVTGAWAQTTQPALREDVPDSVRTFLKDQEKWRPNEYERLNQQGRQLENKLEVARADKTSSDRFKNIADIKKQINEILAARNRLKRGGWFIYYPTLASQAERREAKSGTYTAVQLPSKDFLPAVLASGSRDAEVLIKAGVIGQFNRQMTVLQVIDDDSFVANFYGDTLYVQGWSTKDLTVGQEMKPEGAVIISTTDDLKENAPAQKLPLVRQFVLSNYTLTSATQPATRPSGAPTTIQTRN